MGPYPGGLLKIKLSIEPLTQPVGPSEVLHKHPPKLITLPVRVTTWSPPPQPSSTTTHVLMPVKLFPTTKSSTLWLGPLLGLVQAAFLALNQSNPNITSRTDYVMMFALPFMRA